MDENFDASKGLLDSQYAPASEEEHLLNEDDAAASEYMSTPYQIARELVC
jgi:hypothetical protein